MGQTLKDMISVVPHPRQLAWQKLEFTAFFHFGMNTFTNREWGDGTENPMLFNPTQLDTDQWCESLVLAGINACIITAKHHDGFCIWKTAYTDHCVSNSGYWKDVIDQLAKSCKKYGLKLGIYLSPWDRHESSYGFGDSYNDYFCNQLTELLSNYGDIYAVWFDGACGEGANGKKQQYDWERYYTLIRKLQPDAVISVCGPDVRWCGNEAGSCREAEWSVVPEYLCDNEKVHENSQQVDDTGFRERKLDSSDEDLGSRRIIEKAEGLIWYPAEVDTSIRPGWFYHPEEDEQVRSLEELKNIYLNSVGGNSVLLLNIPPDTRGLITEYDRTRLKELGDDLQKNFGNIHQLEKNIAADAIVITGDNEEVNEILTPNETYWISKTESTELFITLKEEKAVCYLLLMEQITKSQRIEGFEFYAKIKNDWQKVCEGITVGYKKICPIMTPITAKEWKLVITKSRSNPTLKYFGLF